MLLIVDQSNRDAAHKALRSMFEARKQVFVDLLKWDLPVLAGRYEVDHFDDGEAVYLIVTDGAARHLASARLLKTTRPALLDSLYPDLVARPVPRRRGNQSRGRAFRVRANLHWRGQGGGHALRILLPERISQRKTTSGITWRLG